MLVSLKWLRDYVDCSLDPRDLAEALTMAGLEVESVTKGGPEFSGVVVAKINTITRHPNADKLSICDVAAGDRRYHVVCGASNIKEGNLVPLATVGATIPGGYTIKHSLIRGEASEGMLCSEEELGIGGDNKGIMILDKNLNPGDDLRQALDLDDTVFDVGITPNRADCLSIIGIAREVAALTGTTLRYPDSNCRESGDEIQKATSVEIQSPHLCPRYTARLIRNVRVKTSPSWLKVRLEAVGLRAINNIVDVTNFVMMEYGQPLHAFDFSFLEEGRIVVRGAVKNEIFLSLDEKTRTLNEDTLMICDGVKPVAIAGIMGGLNSEIREETETILLESAYFNPTSIRKTARSLGMSTDASFRFERGVDPEGVIRALDRAAKLIADLSGGTIATGFIDEYPRKIAPPQPILLRTRRVDEILGFSIDPSRIRAIMADLEMTVSETGTDEFLVTPPSFRGDLTREIDLIEEIARINGYDKIPLTLPHLLPLSRGDSRSEKINGIIGDVLLGLGYSEVIHYSFTSPDSSRLLGFPEKHESQRFVTIANPLTEDTSVMRTTLIYGLLECMRKNVNDGNENLKYFETGTIFVNREEGTLPLEKERIAGLLTGSRYGNLWHFKDIHADFYDLKGCLETLMLKLGIQSAQFRPDETIPFLHPGKAAAILLEGEQLGVVGEVHPDVLARMDLSQGACVFELDRSMLVKTACLDKQFREIPRFPAVTRDVAFLIDNIVSAETLRDLSKDNDEELLESVHIFDVYCGPGIPDGMKSIALRFTYRSTTRTLADQEVSDIHGGIVERVLKLSEAKVRGMN